MDSRRLKRTREAVCLVNQKAEEAASAAGGDRARAYQILRQWAAADPILDDALHAVGLLIGMKEDLEARGALQRALSIESLLASR